MSLSSLLNNQHGATFHKALLNISCFILNILFTNVVNCYDCMVFMIDEWIRSIDGIITGGEYKYLEYNSS